MTFWQVILLQLGISLLTGCASQYVLARYWQKKNERYGMKLGLVVALVNMQMFRKLLISFYQNYPVAGAVKFAEFLICREFYKLADSDSDRAWIVKEAPAEYRDYLLGKETW